MFFFDEQKHLEEFFVNLDFYKNYRIVVQEEAQSYHWASEHVTIHPFVIYYKDDGQVNHLNFVMIADNKSTTLSPFISSKETYQDLINKVFKYTKENFLLLRWVCCPI